MAAWGWERWDLSPALWSPARAETETQGWCRHKGALHHHAAKSSLAQPRGCFFSLGHAGRVYYDGCALVTVNGNVVAQVRTPRPYRTVPCSMLPWSVADKRTMAVRGTGLVNSHAVPQGSQFSVLDVEVVTARVCLDDVARDPTPPHPAATHRLRRATLAPAPCAP